MYRKGQYMAIEAVLALALSLIVAVASLGVFGTFRENVLDEIQDRNVEIASSELITSIHNLGATGDGSSLTVDLPETGNRDYTVSFGEDYLEIRSGGSRYTYPLSGVTWASEFRGSAQGTSFQLVRTNNVVEVTSR